MTDLYIAVHGGYYGYQTPPPRPASHRRPTETRNYKISGVKVHLQCACCVSLDIRCNGEREEGEEEGVVSGALHSTALPVQCIYQSQTLHRKMCLITQHREFHWALTSIESLFNEDSRLGKGQRVSMGYTGGGNVPTISEAAGQQLRCVVPWLHFLKREPLLSMELVCVCQ